MRGRTRRWQLLEPSSRLGFAIPGVIFHPARKLDDWQCRLLFLMDQIHVCVCVCVCVRRVFRVNNEIVCAFRLSFEVMGALAGLFLFFLFLFSIVSIAAVIGDP